MRVVRGARAHGNPHDSYRVYGFDFTTRDERWRFFGFAFGAIMIGVAVD